jgi:AAA domain-containing protein
MNTPNAFGVRRIPAMVKIQAIVGLPGTGKTESLLRDVRELLSRKERCRVAITSYTRYSCSVAAGRLYPLDVPVATLYSLAAPHTKEFRQFETFFKPKKKRYQCSLLGAGDVTAIQQFVNDAPSSGPRREREFVECRLQELHACEDEFPSWIHERGLPPSLHYDVTLALWLEAGAPRGPGHPPYNQLFVDEAQDVSVLQARVITALCQPDGLIRAYGDPFQAILTQGLGEEEPPLFAWADETETLKGGYRLPLCIAQLAQSVMNGWGCPPAEDWADLEKPGDILMYYGGAKHRQGFCITHSRATAATLAKACPVRFLLYPQVGKELGLDLSRTPLFGAPAMVKGHESPAVYLHKFAPRFMRAYDEGCPHVRKQVFVALTRAEERLVLHPEWHRRLVG